MAHTAITTPDTADTYPSLLKITIQATPIREPKNAPTVPAITLSRGFSRSHSKSILFLSFYYWLCRPRSSITETSMPQVVSISLKTA